MDDHNYCGRCRSFCARNAPCPCCHACGFAQPHTLARDAIDAYEQRVPGARQARMQDPTANYGWQLTTHLLDVANAAMADEGIEPAARYRVIQAILYGGPNPADAWQREQMTAEFAKTLAGLPPHMTVTPEAFEEMHERAPKEQPQLRTLASAYSPDAPGRGRHAVALTQSVSTPCGLRFAPGEPSEEWVRVWQCTGEGPYLAWLGTDRVPVELDGTYPAGHVAEVTDAR